MVFGTIMGKSFSCIPHLILVFCLALATGAAMPIMMWLFQSVINGLVSIGRGNTGPSNWYLSMRRAQIFSFTIFLI